MVGMGYRTIKTALGAALAIWIGDLLQLQFSTFAGIIVIMCIERTKKQSLQTSLKKFFACLLSLILGSLFFEWLGYNPIVFGIFILLFMPLLVKANIQAGFVTSMVVVLHIYALQTFNMNIAIEEFLIVIIGMTIAFIMNSYMPSSKKDVENYKQQIENNFQKILFEFSAYLRDGERNWGGKEIFETEELINEAKSVAIREVENHLLRKQNKDYFYLEMRESQYELLKRMMPIVSTLGQNLKQKEIFADFLEDLSEYVHAGNTTERSFQKLEEARQLIRETELPKTREEFETRANLFYLINEMENYLELKKKLFTGDENVRK